MHSYFNTFADIIERHPKFGMGLPVIFGTVSAVGAEAAAHAFFLWVARAGILLGAIGAGLSVLIHIRNLRKKD